MLMRGFVTVIATNPTQPQIFEERQAGGEWICWEVVTRNNNTGHPCLVIGMSRT